MRVEVEEGESSEDVSDERSESEYDVSTWRIQSFAGTRTLMLATRMDLVTEVTIVAMTKGMAMATMRTPTNPRNKATSSDSRSTQSSNERRLEEESE